MGSRGASRFGDIESVLEAGATPTAQYQPDQSPTQPAGDEYALPQQGGQDAQSQRDTERGQQRGQAGFSDRETAKTDRHEARDFRQWPGEEPDGKRNLHADMMSQPGVQQNKSPLDRQ